jgi:hypothetical protein
MLRYPFPGTVFHTTTFLSNTHATLTRVLHLANTTPKSQPMLMLLAFQTRAEPSKINCAFEIMNICLSVCLAIR